MTMVNKAKYQEIETRIESIFSTEMEVEDFTGDTVPTLQDFPDKNKGLIITNCTILFVDIRSSTKLSDKTQAKNMAKIYRAFARAMSMCINESGGRVRQITGDRVMGVFVDDADESSVKKAMFAAQAILTVVEHLFNPLCRTNVNGKEIGCGVGLDTGRILTSSIGMKHRGEDTRDLVWTGKVANVASKHTDLAEANEIFVTKRFYDKLPQSFKKKPDGKLIWEKTYRQKADSFFEGYGVSGFYLDELLEESKNESRSAVTANPIKAGATDTSQIVTDIVQGIETKLEKLLDNFEQVVRREVNVARKERSVKSKMRELYEREEDIKRKELELQKKEQDIPRVLKEMKLEMEYELKIIAFRERYKAKTLKLSEFFIELKKLRELGAKIGKSIGTVHENIYSWVIVYYLNDQNEYESAFQELIRQLTDETPVSVLVNGPPTINILQKLGVENKMEYFRAAVWFLHNKNNSPENYFKIKETLSAIGLKTGINSLPHTMIEKKD